MAGEERSLPSINGGQETVLERLHRATQEFDQAMRDAVPEADVQHMIRRYQDILRVHASIHESWTGAGTLCNGPDIGLSQEKDSDWEPCSLSNLERSIGDGLDMAIRGVTFTGFDLVVKATTTRGTPAT